MHPASPNASFSRLGVYDECPRHYQYKYIDRVPEPERPEQHDKKGNIKPPAHVRGSWIHDQAEQYIHGKIHDSNLPYELMNIKPELRAARQQLEKLPETVITEQKWYSNELWMPIEPPTEEHPGYYLITIIDCILFDPVDPTKARICDIKSGKRYNNESKHQRQLQLYALAAFHRYPDLYAVESELWYSDLGLIHKKYMTRPQILPQQTFWDNKIAAMQNDLFFVPKPSVKTCNFCPYGKKKHSNKWVNKSDHCQESIVREDFMK